MTKRKSLPEPAALSAGCKKLETLPADQPAAWERGGPSPNPNGRPPKQQVGPVTEKMNIKVETIIGGEVVEITLRGLLDRVTQAEARDKGGRSLKLWRSRQQYEKDLARRYAERLDLANATGERIRRETASRDAFLHAIELFAPGYLDAHSSIDRLKERGIEPAPPLNKSHKKD